jgi:fructokinase
MKMNNIFLGLDIGGTKVEAAIARVDFTSGEIQVLAKKRILVKTNTNFIELICDITELIQALLTEAALSIDALTAIGAGLPGSIDPVTQKMLNGNTRYLIQQDFISALQASLQQKIQSSNNKQIPIFIQNDANLFIYAESIFGRGKSYEQDFKIPRSQQVAIGITLGTGVGGGFVTQGKILNGAHGAALEVGHISLNPQGPLCYCGQRGCAETYLSGTALSKLPPFHDSRKLFSEQSHPEAQTIFSDYRKHMVHFLSILNNLFNPHYIVFGGGLSLQPSLFLGLKAELEKNIFLPAQFCPEIYTQQLGDSAAIFGAMAYANEKNSGL